MAGFQLRRQYPPGSSRFSPGRGQARFSSVGFNATGAATGAGSGTGTGGGGGGGAMAGGDNPASTGGGGGGQTGGGSFGGGTPTGRPGSLLNPNLSYDGGPLGDGPPGSTSVFAGESGFTRDGKIRLSPLDPDAPGLMKRFPHLYVMDPRGASARVAGSTKMDIGKLDQPTSNITPPTAGGQVRPVQGAPIVPSAGPSLPGSTTQIQPGIEKVNNPSQSTNPDGSTTMHMSDWGVKKGYTPQTTWNPADQSINNTAGQVAPGQKVKFVWTDPVTGKRTNIY